MRSRVLGGVPPAVHLCAIGKHPGWDDHIEAIGLDSEPLAAAREILYVRGIGGVIDSAEWDKHGEVLSEFDHVLCWCGEADTLLGRMWSSADGKGRARYPMLAVAHIGLPFVDVPLAATAQLLDRVRTACQQASAAAEVRAIFAQALEELRAIVAGPAPEAPSSPPSRPISAPLLQTMGLDKGETFARALYAIRSKAEACALSRHPGSGKITLRMLEKDAPAQDIRLPASPQDSVESIAFWREVVAGFTGTKLPLLFIRPAGFPWLDLIIGSPTAKQLYCIKANETALPLASSVPYTMDDDFRQTAAKFIGKLCDSPNATLESPAVTRQSSPSDSQA